VDKAETFAALIEAWLKDPRKPLIVRCRRDADTFIPKRLLTTENFVVERTQAVQEPPRSAKGQLKLTVPQSDEQNHTGGS
jgi:hypothetical protein